jgi:putative PIN family toxin of toxin-antitoxin system
MRLIVDTNVFISGIFFTGPPFLILDAWRKRIVGFVVSSEILDEYRETGLELSSGFPGVDIGPWLALVESRAIMINAAPLDAPVCSDPDDDKFLACALSARVRLIVSGDKALQRVSGHAGATVLSPRQFVDRHLG